MKTDELNSILDRFDKISVLVIGDLMIDRFIYGTVSRISPEAPVPLIDVLSEDFKLGGAANAINNIKALGGKVIAVGIVGEDWFGKRLNILLKRNEIDTTGIIECKQRPTTVKTRVIAGQQQIVRFDRERREPIPDEYADSILKFIKEKIQSVDAILLSDYKKGIVKNNLLFEIISLAKRNQKPIIVYPKVEPFFNYKGVTVVITNAETASSVTGITQINETSIRNMGQWLLTHLECEAVLITRGKDGMSLFDTKGNVTHLPIVPHDFVNVTGSIDTVASVITLSLATGNSTLVDSTILANIASMTLAMRKGERLLTRDDLKNQLTSMSD